jgi:hypothetical protein
MKKHKNRYLVLLLLLLVLLGATYVISFKKDLAKVVEYYMVYIPESEDEVAPQDSILIEGCGTEYLVKVASNNATKGGLQESLTELLAIDSADYDGTDYMNALALSDGTVNVTETTDLLQIDITGKLMSAGSCDDPRLTAQVERTIELYALDKPYEIRLNGSNTNWKCFGDMSGECQ